MVPDISTPALNAVYGQWTYHWWGYDRKFTNTQAKELAGQCELIAIGAGAASAIFPPIAALGGLSAAYYALLANRINANNQGNGVYVAITWAAVFNIEPL